MHSMYTVVYYIFILAPAILPLYASPMDAIETIHMQTLSYKRRRCQCPYLQPPILQPPGLQEAHDANAAEMQCIHHQCTSLKTQPLEIHLQPPTSEIISQVPPRRAVTIPNVKIPAPAFSAVVIGESAMPSLLVEELLVPAFESPTLVPPVVFVTRTLDSSIKFAWMTSSADIC
jgi:hypothetical protein